MKLTRAMLTAALAAGAASALPRLTSGADYSNAKEPSKESLGVTLAANEKRSQHYSDPRMELGSSDCIQTVPSTRRDYQGAEPGSQNAESPGFGQDFNAMPADLNTRDDSQMPSSADNEMLSVHQTATEDERHGTADGVSSSRRVNNFAVMARNVFKEAFGLSRDQQRTGAQQDARQSEQAEQAAEKRNDENATARNQEDARRGTRHSNAMPQNSFSLTRSRVGRAGTDITMEDAQRGTEQGEYREEEHSEQQQQQQQQQA
ncbi:hypothetical protein MYCTH_2128552 [Thermothelomyces thermophilus ATCC 42464]|uniref:Uncharacterized protein n=1 Tax=Thermothelomyces thermophilus (strain ATCC 42464 / BCRC 31852 / DSM 1799) TaxID=573729 RepID=G2QIB2_THET4|nr:uncharacterized protein MYCTH_2128552 [Thermothelomyces thermophilus ATCC 42464]AEO59493.1 hypothetical protein MYCTH_2128552 [Thermothelomyces thermophilus ATCC 42464]